jgi:xylulose-5-phosphate/fructose-6-phosphate phosphoketolase
LESLMRGYGYEPFTLEGDDPAVMHQQAAAVFDTMLDRIAAIQKAAREEGSTARPAWPMLIMRTPKGWTGPKFVDGKPVENTWRAHQVPLRRDLREARAPAPARRVDAQLQARGTLRREGPFREDLAEIAPKGRLRMGMNPHANGGLLLKPLKVPNFRDFAVKIEGRGQKPTLNPRAFWAIAPRGHAGQHGAEELPRLRPR